MPQVPPLIAPPEQVIPDGRDYNRPDKKYISLNNGDPGHKVNLTPTIAADISVLDIGDDNPQLTQGEVEDLIRQLPRDRDQNAETQALGQHYSPIRITVKSNRFNMAGMTRAEVAEKIYPEPGLTLGAGIGLSGANSKQLIGAGRVWNSKPRATTGINGQKAEIGVTITAYDEVKTLKGVHMTRSFSNRRISSIVNEVYRHANVRGNVDISPKANERISVSYNNKQCGKILNDLSRRVNGLWYVAIPKLGNTILFTDNLEVDTWNIGGIIKTNVGLQAKPYTKVVVIGGVQRGERGKGGYMFEVTSGKKSTIAGDGSQGNSKQDGSKQGGNEYMFEVTSGKKSTISGGGASKHVIAQDPVRAVIGKGNRVFKHIDRTLTSQKQARKVAKSLYTEFRRQQRFGTITIAGDPRIHPLDVIRTPPSLNHTKYIVSEVEHRLEMSKGYKTIIHVAGTVKGGPIKALSPNRGGGGGGGNGGNSGSEGSLENPKAPELTFGW